MTYLVAFRPGLKDLIVLKYVDKAAAVAAGEATPEGFSAYAIDSENDLAKYFVTSKSLVELFNAIAPAGASPVKKFESRDMGMRRFMQRLEDVTKHLPVASAPVNAISSVLPDAGSSAGAAEDTKTMNDTTTTEHTETATKPKRKKKNEGDAPAADATPKEKKARVLKTDGVVYQIKELLFADPKLSTDDLVAKLTARGFTPSENTVAAFRQDFVHSMRFLKSKGIEIPGVEA